MWWLFSKLKTNVNSNSSFFIFWGSIFLAYLVSAYTLPALDLPKYSGVTQHLLVPILVAGAISSYLIAGIIGYMSSENESGYVVPGFLVWLLLTGVGSYAYIYSTNGAKKAVPEEKRAESKQEVIKKSRKSRVQPFIDLHESSQGSYKGLCENLPDLTQDVAPGVIGKEFWQTMKCASTTDKYALSFGDSFAETDWRWCMDSSGFTGEANLDKEDTRCQK